MPKAPLKITKSQNTRIINSINRQARDNRVVLVGVQSEGVRDDKKLTNVEIAARNEFGTNSQPERSFIRASILQNSQKYKDNNEVASKSILDGKLSVPQYLGLLGQMAADDMKQFAIDLRQPPNSPGTIKRKKSDNPLVDTKQMINSITYAVVDSDNMATQDGAINDT